MDEKHACSYNDLAQSKIKLTAAINKEYYMKRKAQKRKGDSVKSPKRPRN